LIIQQLENELFNIMYEEKKCLGTNEYDLYVTMEGGKVKEILSGTVITYGEWLEIEEFMDLPPLVLLLNDIISKEHITYC